MLRQAAREVLEGHTDRCRRQQRLAPRRAGVLRLVQERREPRDESRDTDGESRSAAAPPRRGAPPSATWLRAGTGRPRPRGRSPSTACTRGSPRARRRARPRPSDGRSNARRTARIPANTSERSPASTCAPTSRRRPRTGSPRAPTPRSTRSRGPDALPAEPRERQRRDAEDARQRPHGEIGRAERLHPEVQQQVVERRRAVVAQPVAGSASSGRCAMLTESASSSQRSDLVTKRNPIPTTTMRPDDDGQP